MVRIFPEKARARSSFLGEKIPFFALEQPHPQFVRLDLPCLYVEEYRDERRRSIPLHNMYVPTGSPGPLTDETLVPPA